MAETFGFSVADAGLPEEYWPCALCIEAMMTAYGQGKVENLSARRALLNSGLIENWPGKEGYFQATARGNAFVEMILKVPLPVQKWVDPRDAERK